MENHEFKSGIELAIKDLLENAENYKKQAQKRKEDRQCLFLYHRDNIVQSAISSLVSGIPVSSIEELKEATIDNDIVLIIMMDTDWSDDILAFIQNPNGDINKKALILSITNDTIKEELFKEINETKDEKSEIKEEIKEDEKSEIKETKEDEKSEIKEEIKEDEKSEIKETKEDEKSEIKEANKAKEEIKEDEKSETMETNKAKEDTKSEIKEIKEEKNTINKFIDYCTPSQFIRSIPIKSSPLSQDIMDYFIMHLHYDHFANTLNMKNRANDLLTNSRYFVRAFYSMCKGSPEFAKSLIASIVDNYHNINEVNNMINYGKIIEGLLWRLIDRSLKLGLSYSDGMVFCNTSSLLHDTLIAMTEKFKGRLLAVYHICGNKTILYGTGSREIFDGHDIQEGIYEADIVTKFGTVPSPFTVTLDTKYFLETFIYKKNEYSKI